MKTIFIINPSAGKGHGIDKLKENIYKAAERLNQNVGIYMTKKPGDAESFSKTFCQETLGKEEGRLFACGGDGTLNEVINGVIGFQHVSVGLVPIGTGNDFVRNFQNGEDFYDIMAQLRGEAIACDAVKYWGNIDHKEQTRYCANMFNIGFDCNVVDMAAKLKNYPLIAGSFAYLMAVAVILVKKKGAKLRIWLDEKEVENGAVLLTAIANGGYCGGGVNSSPYASVQDGILDVNIIYNVSRIEFLKKFPYYSKGTHMDLKDIDRILLASTCRTAKIVPLEGTMRLCTDGEIVDAGTVEFQVAPGAFHFLVPKKDLSSAVKCI